MYRSSLWVYCCCSTYLSSATDLFVTADEVKLHDLPLLVNEEAQKKGDDKSHQSTKQLNDSGAQKSTVKIDCDHVYFSVPTRIKFQMCLLLFCSCCFEGSCKDITGELRENFFSRWVHQQQTKIQCKWRKSLIDL